jgi:hypothetical protein
LQGNLCHTGKLKFFECLPTFAANALDGETTSWMIKLDGIRKRHTPKVCTVHPNAQPRFDMNAKINLKNSSEELKRNVVGMGHDINSSIYARCPVAVSCLSNTERTSMGGLRLRDSARLHRFIRAIPMQGCIQCQLNGPERLVLSESQDIAQNIPRIGWKDQSAAISSLPARDRHDEL